MPATANDEQLCSRYPRPAEAGKNPVGSLERLKAADRRERRSPPCPAGPRLGHWARPADEVLDDARPGRDLTSERLDQVLLGHPGDADIVVESTEEPAPGAPQTGFETLADAGHDGHAREPWLPCQPGDHGLKGEAVEMDDIRTPLTQLRGLSGRRRVPQPVERGEGAGERGDISVVRANGNPGGLDKVTDRSDVGRTWSGWYARGEHGEFE